MNYIINFLTKNRFKQRIFEIKRKDGTEFSNLELGLYFFVDLPLHSYINFFENILLKEGKAYTDNNCIWFGYDEGSEFDNILPIKDNFVRMTTFEHSTDLSIKQFYELCLQFACKALEAVDFFDLLKHGEVNSEWIKSIENIVPQIENKIKTL